MSLSLSLYGATTALGPPGCLPYCCHGHRVQRFFFLRKMQPGTYESVWKAQPSCQPGCSIIARASQLTLQRRAGGGRYATSASDSASSPEPLTHDKKYCMARPVTATASWNSSGHYHCHLIQPHLPKLSNSRMDSFVSGDAWLHGCGMLCLNHRLCCTFTNQGFYESSRSALNNSLLVS